MRQQFLIPCQRCGHDVRAHRNNSGPCGRWMGDDDVAVKCTCSEYVGPDMTL